MLSDAFLFLMGCCNFYIFTVVFTFWTHKLFSPCSTTKHITFVGALTDHNTWGPFSLLYSWRLSTQASNWKKSTHTPSSSFLHHFHYSCKTSFHFIFSLFRFVSNLTGSSFSKIWALLSIVPVSSYFYLNKITAFVYV